jgi:hypothetical protein
MIQAGKPSIASISLQKASASASGKQTSNPPLQG